MSLKPVRLGAMVLVVALVPGCDWGAGDETDDRPNILLITADDLGYSDISPYGAEIRTPNLHALADSGIRFTRFYAGPTCSPSRAMLMSGVSAHLAGLGTMAERRQPHHESVPGYEGVLNQQVAALPEVLQKHGYATSMTGKWHLGKDAISNPKARGFDRSFALLDGAAFHLNGDGYRNPATTERDRAYYAEDGRDAEVPDDFYSTRFYTDTLISYLDEARGSGKPFFAFLSLTAPHWPLQVPAASRDKYAGVYDEGYDVWYQRRLDGMKAAGVFPAGGTAFPRYPGERPWAELSAAERRYSARKMEIQSAMIDDMDQYIGKLFDYLKRTGQYENTVILFMSDNGIDGRVVGQRVRSIGSWPDECCDNSLDNLGAADSYVWIGRNWGRVSSGPYRLWKSSTAEGGTRVPVILKLPGSDEARIYSGMATVKDVLPTLLELAGIDPVRGEFDGRAVLPVQGESLVGPLTGQDSLSEVRELGLELTGKQSYIQGDWKILLDSDPFGDKSWTLHYLPDDPGEQLDLSAERPEKMSEMLELWNRFAEDNNVVRFD